MTVQQMRYVMEVSKAGSSEETRRYLELVDAELDDIEV